MASNQNNDSSDEEQFVCEKCGQKYKQSSSLSRHKKTCGLEVVELSCSKCGNLFNRKDNLDRHITTCKGKSEWKCANCQKTFQFASYLARHTCQFKCSVCGKKLKTEDQPHQCKIVVKRTSNVPTKNESLQPESPQPESPQLESPQPETYSVPSEFWEVVNVALLLALDEEVKVGRNLYLNTPMVGLGWFLQSVSSL